MNGEKEEEEEKEEEQLEKGGGEGEEDDEERRSPHRPLGLQHVGDEEGAHERIGGLLHEDLVGLEVGHATVGPPE